MRGLLRENSQGHVRGRVDSLVREMRSDLGPSADDGSNDGTQQRLRLCHLREQGWRPGGSSSGMSWNFIPNAVFSPNQNRSGNHERILNHQ